MWRVRKVEGRRCLGGDLWLLRVLLVFVAMIGVARGQDKPTSTQRVFTVINDDYPGRNMTAMIQYLTDTVGPLFDPPIQFSLVVSDSFEDYWLRDIEKADFILGPPNEVACLTAERGMVPLVSIIDDANGEGKAGFLFAKANSAIQSVVDLKGKSVESNALMTIPSMSLMRAMAEEGFNLLVDAKQIVFSGWRSQDSIFFDVLEGLVDAGMARAGDMEHLIAKGLLQRWQIKEINSMDGHGNTFDGKTFQYDTTGRIYPQFGLVSRAGISNQLRSYIVTALTQMKSDHPAFQRLDFKQWVVAQSYTDVHELLRMTGFLKYMNESVPVCTRAYDIYKAINCPAGYYKRTEEEVRLSCQDRKITCPRNDVVSKQWGGAAGCVCDPCRKAEIVELRQARGMVCSKMMQCGQAQQRETYLFEVVDNAERMTSKVTWTVTDLTVYKNGTASHFYNTSTGAHTHAFQVQLERTGTYILEIFVDGVGISSSPVLFLITDRICSDPLQMPDDEGICACRNNAYTTVSGGCIASSTVIPAIVLPVIFVIAVILFFIYKKKLQAAMSVYIIDASDLILDTPPVILGKGSFGVVVAANYRGTRVAVKRAITHKSRSRRSKMPSLDESCSDPHMQGIRGQQMLDSASQSTTYNDSERGSVRQEGSARSTLKKSCSIDSVELGRNFNQPEDIIDRLRMMLGMRSHYGNELMQEISLLCKLRHPNITTIMGAVNVHGNYPMIVVEYMENGSLYDLLHNPSVQFDNEVTLPIVQDICKGIQYLHTASPPICHGDIKSSNVLIDSRFRAKVADFGLAIKKRMCGTLFFMAPELLHGGEFTPQSDVYALGILLYEIYSRREPYENMKANVVCSQIFRMAEGMHMRPTPPADCNPDAARIMKQCWHWDPQMRPNVAEIASFFEMMCTVMMADMELRKNDNNRQFGRQTRWPSPRLKPNHARGQGSSDTAGSDMRFPDHIQAIISKGEAVKPESLECVTVLIIRADIDRFGGKDSMVLKRLYAQFDLIAMEKEVFRIETHDEEYMAITNLDHKTDIHTLQMGRFALACLQCAQNFEISESERMNLRKKARERGSRDGGQRESENRRIHMERGLYFGIHAGNALGSVKKSRYFVSGPAVSMACILAENGASGKIQVSKDCAMKMAVQGPGITFVVRGPVHVKSKGTLFTYFLSGESPAGKGGQVNAFLQMEAKKQAVSTSLGNGTLTLGSMSNIFSIMNGKDEMAYDLMGSKAAALSLQMSLSQNSMLDTIDSQDSAPVDHPDALKRSRSKSLADRSGGVHMHEAAVTYQTSSHDSPHRPSVEEPDTPLTIMRRISDDINDSRSPSEQRRLFQFESAPHEQAPAKLRDDDDEQQQQQQQHTLHQPSSGPRGGVGDKGAEKGDNYVGPSQGNGGARDV